MLRVWLGSSVSRFLSKFFYIYICTTSPRANVPQGALALHTDGWMQQCFQHWVVFSYPSGFGRSDVIHCVNGVSGTSVLLSHYLKKKLVPSITDKGQDCKWVHLLCDIT